MVWALPPQHPLQQQLEHKANMGLTVRVPMLAVEHLAAKAAPGLLLVMAKDMEREPVPAVQMVHQAVKGKMVVVTIVPAVKAALVHLVGQVVLAVQQAKVHQES